MGCAGRVVPRHASLLAAYRKPSMARRALMISGAGPLNFMASAQQQQLPHPLTNARACYMMFPSVNTGVHRSSPNRDTLYD